MKYITSTELINEVKNGLNTWFESGMVDETILYRKIRLCLSQMGMKVLPEKNKMLSVKNYQVTLPNDFHMLYYAIGCTNYTTTYRDSSCPHWEEEFICELETCKTECDYHHDECGNRYNLVQKFPKYTIEWQEFYNFTIVDSQPYCASGCFNQYGCANEIKIQDGKIITNFDKGYIWLVYLSQLEENGDYLIPDKEQIIQWLIDEMRVTIFQYLFDNGIGDVLQRLQIAKQDLMVTKGYARNFIKTSEVKDFYNVTNTLINRYKRFKL